MKAAGMGADWTIRAGGQTREVAVGAPTCTSMQEQLQRAAAHPCSASPLAMLASVRTCTLVAAASTATRPASAAVDAQPACRDSVAACSG